MSSTNAVDTWPKLLLEDQLHSSDPVGLFSKWIREATATVRPQDEFYRSTATLSTATKSGIPSSRTVRIRSFSNDGFQFSTNTHTKKGVELAENPVASMVVYWWDMHQQVRIEGTVEIMNDDVSEKRFNEMARLYQIMAIVSDKLDPLNSRKELDDLYDKVQRQYPEGTPIPRPEYWRCYLLRPKRFEFWQEQQTSLHDRIVFDKSNDTWKMYRLTP